VAQREQHVIDRGGPSRESQLAPAERHGAGHEDALLAERRRAAERAARAMLRVQITRLERELSEIVAAAFPHISPAHGAAQGRAGGSLLGLEQLERSRDRLAGRVQELRALAAGRAEHERRAREQLQRMKLEPGRYRFVRLPVSDLGQGGCGVWEVRPRLGLIGMLAGWWQLKLSSGCPLPRGSRSTRDPFPARTASQRACGADARSSSRASSSPTSEAVKGIFGSGSGPSGAGS
jgi:hypothetical protein